MDDLLLRDAHRNYVGSMAALMACSLPGESLEGHDVAICSSGLPSPEFNLVFLKTDVLRDLDDAIEQGRAYFAARGLPHQFRIRKGYEHEPARRLAQLGYQQKRPVIGMVLAQPQLPEYEPAELEVRSVRGEALRREFGRVAFEGFGHRADAAPQFLTDQLIEHPDIECFLGYWGGRPVCTAMLIAIAGIAGVYWVATLPAYRKHGFGEAITWAAIRAGLARGCRAASLQASDMGRPLYARMGFEVGPLYWSYESGSE